MPRRTVVRVSDKHPSARTTSVRVRVAQQHPVDRRVDNGQPGATCKLCGTGPLEYDGLFNLVCAQCGQVAHSAGFT